MISAADVGSLVRQGCEGDVRPVLTHSDESERDVQQVSPAGLTLRSRTRQAVPELCP
jgi:hypothetical protein